MLKKLTKFEELESIRGIAALLIVILHISLFNQITFFNNCYLMVEIFFVLSGFVIHRTYQKKITTLKKLLEFWFLRFGRLYPIHLIFLFGYLLLEFIKYLLVSKVGAAYKIQPFNDQNYIEAFILNLFLMQGLWNHYKDYPLFNGPAWSISVEFYTYFVFALINLKFYQFKHYFYLGISAFSIYFLIKGDLFYLSFGFLRCLAGFFIGCLVSECININRFNINKYISFICLAIIIVLLSVKNQNNTNLDFLIYFPTALLIYSLCKRPDGHLNKALKMKFLIWLGTISYSVYMSHYIILRINDIIETKILLNFMSFSVFPYLIPALHFFFIIICVLLLSSFMYYFVELPFRNKSREFIFSHKKYI